MEQENKTDEITEKKTDKKTKPKQSDKRFSKEQLIKSQSYFAYRDLLNALLEDGKLYSKSEANKLINDYKNKAVK